ncbi:MAG: hypothetical protein BAA03_12585 [Caldibacillus debilis]|nr:MAG: hypothetical protein BAA03_12585 [Caldibacillus debilis]
MIPFLRHPCGIPSGSQEKHGKPLVPNGSESARRTDGNLRSGRLYERKFFPCKNFAGKGIFPRKDGFNLKKREDFSQKIRFESEEKTRFLPEKDLSQRARTWASPEKRKTRSREKVPPTHAKSLSRCREGPPLKTLVSLKAELYSRPADKAKPEKRGHPRRRRQTSFS